MKEWERQGRSGEEKLRAGENEKLDKEEEGKRG